MDQAPELPLTRALARTEALAALDALAGLPHAFLLHSALPDARARWSFFGADPFAWFHGAGYDEAVARWRRLAKRAGRAPGPTPPFTGGAVGTWTYDFGRRLERLPVRARDDLALPDFVLGFYDVVGAIDHATGTAWLFSSGLPIEGREREARARERLEVFARRIESGASAPRRHAAWRLGAPAPTFERAGSPTAGEQGKEHIPRGDIFPAKLSP